MICPLCGIKHSNDSEIIEPCGCETDSSVKVEAVVMWKFVEEIKNYITETAHYIPHASVKKKCLGCKFAKRRDNILEKLNKFST